MNTWQSSPATLELHPKLPIAGFGKFKGPQALSKHRRAGAGEDADPRMTQAASARGIRLTSKSRPLNPEDLTDYDYIIGMDAKNLDAMKV